MGNTAPSSSSGPAAVSGNTYARLSVDNRNNVTRTGPAPTTVTPPAPATNGVTHPVRCPRCRRLLQPPAGHSRFLCPCGQMLMAPAATEQVHVRCPRCQTTLAPPPGASVFRCPCGVALRAPLQRGGSARAINDGTPSGTGAGAVSGPVVPGGGKFEDENLLPDEIIANTVRKPNEEHWILNSGRDDKLYWVRLMSEEQQSHIQKLIKETGDNMKANLEKLSVREMKEKLEGMGIDTADALDKGDLSSMLLNSFETVNGKSVEEIKSLLDSHSTDYTFCLVKEELSELLVAVGWYGEAHFSDGFVRKFVSEFDLEVIPAQKYALDPEFAKYKISPTEIERMSSRPFREKVRWFRDQCKKSQIKWEDGRVQIKIRRSELLRDSFNNFNRLKPIDLRRYLRFEFLGEEGVDAGGVAREWFELVTDSCFNVDCGLFEYSGVDNICYQINPASGIANDLHEQYFHFLGRVVGKALFDHKFIRAHVTQPIYKHMLGYPITMKDIEFCDAHLYQSLQEMQEAADVSDYLLTFTTMLEVFGENQEIELKPGGGEIPLNNNNLQEYIHLMTKYVMFERTKSQLAHFLQGLYDVIPPIWLSIFDYRELELLLCGLPNINVNDWKKNTKYRGAYATKGQTHKVVQWFWEVVEESSQEQRALILQFCTGTSRVPVQGFEALQGNDGNIKPFTIDSAKLSDIVYPKAHTCFNRIELPMYRSKEELVRRFEEALSQGTTGFSDE